MKTGDILLVHTNSTMGKIIQKFQMRKDKDAGYYNHSGIIYVGKHRTWVAEASQVKGRKIKAAVVFTPLDEYTRRYECECGWGGVPCINFLNTCGCIGITSDYNNITWSQ